MIKKSFRLMLLGAFALLSSVFVACDKYDDDIEGLQAQIDALKATVQSIQSEVDGGAVITGVSESATGVTVTLNNGKSFTISNGTDGEDGAAGTPGSVVEIGENGNWYIDGEDTGIAAAGKDGENGSVVEVGENGNLFIDGEDTGITVVGGEAGITAVFENGVLTLYGVEGLEDGFVIGAASHITSLAVVPEKMIDGSLGMPLFENYLVFDKEGEFVASNNFEVTYRVNPTNANTDSLDLSFVTRFVEVRAAAADNTDEIEVVSYAASKNIKGAIDVTARLSDSYELVKENEQSLEVNLFALKALNADGCEIVSDYAVVAPVELTELELVNIDQANEGEFNHILSVDECAAETIFDPADKHRDAYFYYDGELDLLKVVKLYENAELNDFIENYGFEVEYTFSNEKEYLGVDGTTNNNKFVVLDGSVVKVNKEWLKANPNGGKAAIGRTPLIFVEAKINGKVVDTASIKLEVTEKEVVVMRDTLVIEVGPQDFEYSDIDDETMMTLPWERFNIEVYETLGLTAAEFWGIYKGEPTVTAPAGALLAVNKPTEEGAPTSTDIATLTFDPYEIQLGQDSATLVLHPESSYYKEVVVKFHYNITHAPSFPNLNEDYLVKLEGTQVDSMVTIAEEGYAGDYQVVRVKGKLINDVWALQSEMKEFCEDYLEGYVQPGNHNAIKFRIEGLVVEDGKLVLSTSTTNIGACLTDGTTDLAQSVGGNKDIDIKLTTPLAADEPSRVYLIRMSQMMVNGQRCETYFCVEFVRPFEMMVDDITLKTLIAEHDQAHVDSAVVVYDLDGKVIYENCEVTEYAQNVYKFTNDNFKFEYELPALNASWGDEGNKKLNLVANENGENTILDWYNGGGELQNDKNTTVKVTLTIENLAAAAVDGKVTVLSSANSK